MQTDSLDLEIRRVIPLVKAERFDAKIESLHSRFAVLDLKVVMSTAGLSALASLTLHAIDFLLTGF